MHDTIRKLTAGVASGDRRSVELFYRQYFDLMYGCARHASRRDESFCLDVVHDAILRVIRTIRPVHDEPQLIAWLKLVVHSVTYDLLRREQRRVRHERQSSAASDPIVADHSERLEWLRDKLRDLDPHIMRLIEMRYQDNWTLSRIASALGVSIGTIDGRLRRALAQLRHQAHEVCDE